MTDPVILVPLDGSSNAVCALPVAKRLSHLQNVPVRILRTSEQVGPLAATAERLGLGPAHLRGATLEIRSGNPAEAILEAAEDWQASGVNQTLGSPADKRTFRRSAQGGLQKFVEDLADGGSESWVGAG